MLDFLRCWFETNYCCDIIGERVNGKVVKFFHSQIKRLKTFLMVKSLTHLNTYFMTLKSEKEKDGGGDVEGNKIKVSIEHFLDWKFFCLPSAGYKSYNKQTIYFVKISLN